MRRILVVVVALAGGCTVKWPADDSDVAFLRGKVADLEARLVKLESRRINDATQMTACLAEAEAAYDDHIRLNHGVTVTKDGRTYWRAPQMILDAAIQVQQSKTAACQALYGTK